MKFLGLGRSATAESAHIAPARWRLPNPRHWPAPLQLLALLFGLILIWYGVLGTHLARIDADLNLRPTEAQLPPGGSVALGNAARLLERQTQELSFTPNAPSFYPTGLTRRTPAFQTAVVTTVADVLSSIAEGSSEPNLKQAAQAAKTPPNHWWVRLALPPIGRPAEQEYAAAIGYLVAANSKRAENHNVQTALQQDELPLSVRAAIGALQLRITDAARAVQRSRTGTNGAATQAETLAAARGTAYAAHILLRGMRDDYNALIRTSGNAASWSDALDNLALAAQQNPLILRDQHHVEIGYSLMLAEDALRAIRNPPEQG